jgi:hypothetical protein
MTLPPPRRYRRAPSFTYSLERTGVLYGTEAFGPHEWYPEGATLLLKAQGANGSWQHKDRVVWDTCFAILFLRRATRPLVESVDSKRR